MTYRVMERREARREALNRIHQQAQMPYERAPTLISMECWPSEREIYQKEIYVSFDAELFLLDHYVESYVPVCVIASPKLIITPLVTHFVSMGCFYSIVEQNLKNLFIEPSIIYTIINNRQLIPYFQGKLLIKLSFQLMLYRLAYFIMNTSQNQRRLALGGFTSAPQKQFYNSMISLFAPMPKPTSSQWLYTMKENHQSFDLYRIPHYNPVTPERHTIYIQPFDQFDQSFLQKLRIFCSAFYYGLKVEILKPLILSECLKNCTTREEPILNFQKIDNEPIIDKYYGKQYLAQDINSFLMKIIPKDAYCCIGITLKDIYAGKNWNFVFGWASYVSRVGVFSFMRWDQKFAEGKNKQIDWDLILFPSLRTMIHEIGHMFGVTHCVYYQCLMSGFLTIEQNYKRPFQFCPICLRKLSKNIGFKKSKRYLNLIQACKIINIPELKKDSQFYRSLLQMVPKYY